MTWAFKTSTVGRGVCVDVSVGAGVNVSVGVVVGVRVSVGAGTGVKVSVEEMLVDVEAGLP
jgi:UDP-3-O-[3-hydroxymyristoyl] glucosamine N-acyltransferase